MVLRKACQVLRAKRKKLLSATRWLIATAALGVGVVFSSTGYAQVPTGADVVAGQAAILQAGNALDVNAVTDRTIVNWDSFNVGVGNAANFNLPTIDSAILNRVTTADLSSTIAGAINSNGHVMLVNPSGIMVTNSGIVNTNGFTASAFDIANDAFMSGGPMTFSDNGSAAAVVNEGTINTGAGGAHLIANEIANHGSITSTGGNITMSGGGEVTLNNGVNYVQPTMETLAGGISPTAGLIRNSGTVRATGAATSGGDVYLVNPNGAILHDGTIVAHREPTALAAGSSGSVMPEASAGGTQGGHVQLEADDITLSETSSIDVSGTRGGGTALVGGDWQGSGDMRQATTVTMKDGASVDASAIESGDGGKIVLWSDITNKESMTSVAGTLTARGGGSGGDGGAIETSGAHIDTANVAVNAGADQGTGGLWLIDPFSYIIDATEAGNIAGTLNNGTSVTVTTAIHDSSQGSNGVDSVTGGLLRVQSAITKTSGGDATLTLKSDRNMEIEDSITSTAGKLNLVLWANQDDHDQGSVVFERDTPGVTHDIDITTNGGHLWIGGGAGSTTWNGMTVGDGAAHAAVSGSFTSGIQVRYATNITTAGGSIYMAGTTDYSLSRDIRIGGNTGTTIDAGSGSIELVGDNISFTNDSTLETTGELIISPFGTSFVNDSNAATAFTWDGTRSGSDLDGAASLNGLIIKNVDSLGGLTLGKDGTISEIIIKSDTDIAGDVSVYAGTIDVLGDLSAAGDILLDADTGIQLAYDSIGVEIGDATVSTTAASNGSITIVGRGGNQNHTQQGVSLAANSQVTAGGTGDVTITGFGGDEILEGDHHGILILDNNGITAGGDIVLTGNGGGSIGGGGNNDGVRLESGKIGSDSSGSVTINGTTNADGSAAQDILIFGVGSEIRTGAGNDILLRGDSFGLGDNGSGPTPDPRTTMIGNSTSTIGTLTFESVSDSFVDTGFSLPKLTLENLGDLVVGKASNTADVTVATALNLNGSVDIFGGEITTSGIWNIDGAVNILGDGETIEISGQINTTGDNVLIKTTGGVEVVASTSVTTLGGDITLWSDSNNSGEGRIQLFGSVALDSRTAADRTAGAHTSGGGNITLSGGSDLTTGYAHGNGDTGLSLGGTLYSGGGDVLLRGKSNNGTTEQGVEIRTDAELLSGVGSITVIGQSDSGNGVRLADTGNGTFTLSSAKTSGDAIVIEAQSSASHGLLFNHSTTKNELSATGGGDIRITGESTASGEFGIYAAYTQLLATSGTITLDAGSNGLGGGGSSSFSDLVFGAEAGSSVTASSSDVNIISDLFHTNETHGFEQFVDTTGHLTIAPSSTAFDSVAHGTEFAFNGTVASNTLTGTDDAATIRIRNLSSLGGLTIGKEGNTSDIAIGAPVEIAGPLTVYGKTVTLNSDADTTAGGTAGDILLKATDNVIVTGAKTLQTDGGDITLWSDSNAADEGFVLLNNGVTLDSRTATDRTNNTHTTGGGDITLAGGTDSDSDGRPDGFAASALNSAIRLGTHGTFETTMYSGGGDVSIRGNGLSGPGNIMGVEVFGLLTADSGTGAISIVGTSADDTGVFFSQSQGNGAALGLKSSAATGTAISITGTATGASGRGLAFKENATTKTLQATGGGDIEITGTGAAADYGIEMRGTSVLASSGDILVDGNTGGTYLHSSSLGAAAGTDVTSSSSSIAMIGDRFHSASSATSFDSTGTLTIAPHGTSFDGPFGIADTNVTLASSLSGLTIGKEGNASNVAIDSVANIAGPIEIHGGRLTINQAITSTTTDGTITLGTSGQITQGLDGVLTAANLKITTDDGDGGTSGADVTLQNDGNNIATLTAEVDGALVYRDSNALSISPGTTNGITAEETILVETLTGDLTIDGNIVTSASTNSAVVLNAGKNAAAGTSTGGNIIANSSPTITVGSGGRATLYSGDIDASTGLTSLVQSGSGRFRYNSDEAASNFTTAMGAGVYGIYREQPTLTVTADNVSMTYADVTPSFTFSVSGKNGDTAAQSLSTDPTVTIGGSKSTSNNWIVGDHDLTSSGAVSGLGYALAYGTGTGTLTVSQKAITVSGLSVSDRVYDRTTGATVDHSAVIFGGMASGDILTASGTTGVFADKNVGTDKTVTLSNTTYGGTDAGNYAFTDQSTSSADISAKSITVSGLSANDRVYDGTTVATVDHIGVVFSGIVSGDTLTASGTSGAFADKNIGTDKTVTLSNTTYGGTDAGNYTFTDQSASTADITAKSITVSGLSANDRVYDGTAAATVDSSGVVFGGIISGDTLSASGTVGAFADKNVGAGKAVTLSDTTYGGADVGNYTFTDQTSSSADISAKSITVSGLSANDRVYDGTTVATVDHSGVVFGGIVSGDTLTASGTSGAFADKNIGTDKTVTLSDTTYGGTDAGNYTFTDQTSSSADITAKSITVSGLSANDRVYDGTTVATVDHIGVVFSGIVSGDTLTASGTSGAFADKNIGTDKTVTLSNTTYGGTDAGNYTFTDQSTSSADITAKSITVSGLSANDRVYDGTAAATVDSSGVVFGGIISGDTLSASGTVGAFADKNVDAGKAVTLSDTTYGGADVGNYTFTDQTTSSADITAKGITVSGLSANDRVYDGTTVSTVDHSGVVFGGIVSGDTLIASGTSGAFADKSVGTDKTVTLSDTTYGGTDAGNYTFTDQTSSSADITAKSISVSGLSANDRVYDGTTTATVDHSGVVFSGIVSGDTLTASGTSGAFADKNIGTDKTVTLSNTNYGGADVGNYTFTDQTTSSADITAKGITVSGLSANDRVYDGTAAATVDSSGVVFGGVISGDTLSASGTVGAFADKNVGAGKAVTLSDTTYGGADVGNYTFTDQTSSSADITAKGITVSGLSANDRVYDGTAAATVDSSGVVFGGIISGDTLSASGTVGAFADKNVGAGKAVTLSDTTYGGADVGNYTFTDQTTSSADITAKGITVSGLSANDRVYDGTTVSTVDHSGAVFGGIVSGDTLTASGTSGAFADKNIGTDKTVTLSNTTYGGTDAGNYTFTDQTSSSADITAKSISVSGLSANDRVYDGTTVATVDHSGVVFSGIVSGDTLTASGTSGAFADKNIGTDKTVTLSNTNYGGADVGNYTFTDQISSSADISAKSITVSGLSANDRVYDGTTVATVDHSGVVFSGIVSGDTLTASGTSGAFADKNIGTDKTVTLSNTTYGGTDAGNYTFTDQSASTADITAKSITVSGLSANDRVYDGTAAATVDSSGVVFGGIISGDTLSASGTVGAFADKNVGAGKAVTLSDTTYGGADVGNYTFTDQTTSSADITAKGITVSGLSANDRVYDGTTVATVDHSGVVFGGIVSGDTLTASGTSGAFADKNVGAGKGVTLSNTTYGGTDAGNYTFTDQSTSSADITAKSITVSGLSANDRVYDGTTVATVDHSGVVFGGIVSGDTLSASGTVGAFADKNVGAGKAVILSDTTYGGADVGNYTFTDQTTSSADITAKGITVSGLSANDRVYDGTTTATVDHSGVVFGGIVSGDTLSASGTVGAFADKNVGAGKAVTLSDTTYGGADVGNYSIADQVATTADITARSVTVSGLNVSNRVYDGSAVATVEHDGATFDGMVAGDALTASGTSGVFADKNVGANKSVALSGTVYGGASVGNYTFIDQVLTFADISRLTSVMWIGGSTGDWSDPTNWAGGAIPDRANVANVIIPDTVLPTFDDSVSGPVDIESLSGGGLQIDSGALNVANNATLDSYVQTGGALDVGMDFSVDDFDQSGGTVAVVGDFQTTNTFGQTSTGLMSVNGNADVTHTGGELFVGALSGNNVTLSSTNGGVSLGDIDSAGALGVSAQDGDIAQQAGTAVNSGGEATFSATGDVTLANSDNEFSATVNLTGDDVTVQDSGGGLELGEVATLGAFAAISTDGSITQTSDGSVAVAGDATLAASEDGGAADISLANTTNDFGGTVNLTGDNVAVQDGAGGLELGEVLTEGTFAATSTDGSITQTADGSVAVAGDATLAASEAGEGADISLANTTNDFGGTVNLTGGNVSVQDGAGGLTLGAVSTEGTFAATSTDGSITQTSDGSVAVAGDATLTASEAGEGADITLAHTTNEFGGTVNLTGGNVSVQDGAGGLTLGAVSTEGTFAATSTDGSITQTADGSVAVAGDATLAASEAGEGADISLANTTNDFGGTVNLTGGNVSVQDGAGGLEFGEVSTEGTFAATSMDGSITQTADGSVAVAGDATLTASEAGEGADITLAHTTNEFGGTVNLTGGNVSVQDGAGGLTLGAVSTEGTFAATSTDGSITQTPDGSVAVAGDATLAASEAGEASDIELANATNEFGGTVNLNGGNVTVQDSEGELTLGEVLTEGTFAATSTDGSITQTSDGSVDVAGDATFAASADGELADIELGSDANKFGGTVDLIGDNVSVHDSDGGLMLGEVTTDGTFAATSTGGSITQSAALALAISGESSFVASHEGTPADVVIHNPGNEFGGSVSIDGNNVELYGGNDGIELGSVTAAGDLGVAALVGSLTQSQVGHVTVGGEAVFASTVEIELTNQGNLFQGSVFADAPVVSIESSTAFSLTPLGTDFEEIGRDALAVEVNDALVRPAKTASVTGSGFAGAVRSWFGQFRQIVLDVGKDVIQDLGRDTEKIDHEKTESGEVYLTRSKGA